MWPSPRVTPVRGPFCGRPGDALSVVPARPPSLRAEQRRSSGSVGGRRMLGWRGTGGKFRTPRLDAGRPPRERHGKHEKPSGRVLGQAIRHPAPRQSGRPLRPLRPAIGTPRWAVGLGDVMERPFGRRREAAVRIGPTTHTAGAPDRIASTPRSCPRPPLPPAAGASRPSAQAAAAPRRPPRRTPTGRPRRARRRPPTGGGRRKVPPCSRLRCPGPCPTGVGASRRPVTRSDSVDRGRHRRRPASSTVPVHRPNWPCRGRRLPKVTSLRVPGNADLPSSRRRTGRHPDPGAGRGRAHPARPRLGHPLPVRRRQPARAALPRRATPPRVTRLPRPPHRFGRQELQASCPR